MPNLKSPCRVAALFILLGGLAASHTPRVSVASEKRGARPNVIYIMADELGYYEPGFNGGKNIQTPNLDRMAAEGMRFTNMLAGSSVCAPTRCCFLTGKHSGHTSVRVNGGGTPLRKDEATIASILKPLGYATGGFGKWGNGGRDSTGVPEKHGFDTFFGYYDQVHAHSYYPPYLIRNSEEVVLPGNKGRSEGETYSQYAIHNEAVEFIHKNHKQPFFAYLPYTPPHGIFDIPDEDPAWELYKDKPWSEQARRYAAMVGMLDRQVGEILSLVRDLGIEENTLVFFSGDNGGADYFSSKEHPRGVHSANKHPETGVEFRGKKGDLYEGGLRIPFIARWPGKIAPGTTSDYLGYFPDILPTVAQLTGAVAPEDIDGISILPTLIGEKAAGSPQQIHPYLYWEMGNQVALRVDDWRLVKGKKGWELYNLASDPSESIDLSAIHPERVEQMATIAAMAHQPAVEGTFTRTDRHQRDRRAKMGQHDNVNAPDPLSGKPAPKTEKMPTEGMLSHKDWKLVRFSSENSSNDKLAANAIDGNPATHWHSRFTVSTAKPPHELVIDLGSPRSIEGVVFLARQDNSWNGALKDVEIFISDDPDNFKVSSAKAQLKKERSPQTVKCPTAKGRYVLIRATSSHGDQEIGSLAELGIIGR